MNNYYFIRHRKSGMGPVTRGICVLKALGGGTLICSSAFHWAATQEGLNVREVNTWLDLPSSATAIFDLLPAARARQVINLRARKYQVLRDAPRRGRLFMPLMHQVFSIADNIEGAVPVGPIVPDIDKERANRWWGFTAPRILIVQAGATRGEVLVLAEMARRAGVKARICNPWAKENRYWPATELMATADVVISGGGQQTRAECERFGVPLLAYPFGRGDQQGIPQLTAPNVANYVDAAMGTTKTIVKQSTSGAVRIAEYINGR